MENTSGCLLSETKRVVKSGLFSYDNANVVIEAETSFHYTNEIVDEKDKRENISIDRIEVIGLLAKDQNETCEQDSNTNIIISGPTHLPSFYKSHYLENGCSAASSDVESVSLDGSVNAANPTYLETPNVNQYTGIDGRPKDLKIKKMKSDESLESRLSPSEIWQLKKELKEQKKISRKASRTIKSGWKMRMQLHDIQQSPSKSINSFYLETVESGSVENVQALLNCCKTDVKLKLNKNYIDQKDFDALRVAIRNRDVEMCNLLLDHNVNLRHNLFHAIESNFLDGVKAILCHDQCKEMTITEHNYYFEVGLTPIIFAAHKNNYEILKLLYENDHRMKKSVSWWDGLNYALESANQRILFSKAHASPAYITLICEKNRKNPMKLCLNLIKDIREDAEIEAEFSDFYDSMITQIESFMCSLLDQVQSSEELAQLFQYDFDAYWNTNSFDSFGSGVLSRKAALERLSLLDTASEYNLKKFVTHQNSQLALSYVKNRYTTFLKNKNTYIRTAVGLLFGPCFPILSLFYLIAPNSKLGGIIALPTILFFCHLFSEIIFIFLLFLHVVSKTPEKDYLGAKPTVVEWLILFWLLGKLLQAFRQAYNRGIQKYILDRWNYINIFQLALFSVAIGLRIADYINHYDDTKRVLQNEWKSSDARMISSGFLAWAYIFVFLRVMSAARTNRLLGPLQVSLAKMFYDVAQFFTIFILFLFAFALALTEIFWGFGKELDGSSLCYSDDTNSSNCNFAFSGVWLSMRDLFWSIFGYFELSTIPNSNRIVFAYSAGMSLLWTYQVVAVIILTNTLIAMMAKSYEMTSQNRDIEWKFHRTVVWIRYVRREFTRPPPMNLIPNPYAINKQLRRFAHWIAYSVFHCKRHPRNCELGIDQRKKLMNLMYSKKRTKNGAVHLQLRELESAAVVVKKNLRKQLAEKILFVLLDRHKFGKLLLQYD